MAKLTGVIKELNSINENTKDTKNMLTSLLAQDKAQDEQAKKDKKLNDEDDKKQGGLSKIIEGSVSPIKDAAKGFGEKFGDFIKTLLGLGALQFLMDPNFQKMLDAGIQKIKDFWEQMSTGEKIFAGVAAGLTALTAAYAAWKVATAPIRVAAKVARAVTGTGRTTGGGLDEARKIKAAQIETERFNRAQRIAKDVSANGRVVKTDIGDLKVDEKTGRIKDVKTNRFVNTKTGLDAIEKATPKTIGERISQTLAPDDSFRRRLINQTADFARAPVQAITGSGRGSMYETAGERAAYLNRPKTGVVDEGLRRAIQATEAGADVSRGAMDALKVGARTTSKVLGPAAVVADAAFAVSDVGQAAANMRAEGREQSIAGNALELGTSIVGGIAALSDLANNWTNRGINNVFGTDLKTDYDLQGQITGNMREGGYAGIEKIGADKIASENLNTGLIWLGQKVDTAIANAVKAFTEPAPPSPWESMTPEEIIAMYGGGSPVAVVNQVNNGSTAVALPQTAVKTPLD